MLTSDVDEQLADGTSVINLVATVKDANNNLVTGEDVTFSTTGSALYGTNISATVTTNASGEATTTITDTVVEGGTGTATPADNAAGAATNTLNFKEVPPTPMDDTTKIKVNGAEFSATDGFPKTEFVGATFRLAMEGNTSNNSNYTWSVKIGSWLTVDASGNVKFNSEGNGQAVILATPTM